MRICAKEGYGHFIDKQSHAHIVLGCKGVIHWDYFEKAKIISGE